MMPNEQKIRFQETAHVFFSLGSDSVIFLENFDTVFEFLLLFVVLWHRLIHSNINGLPNDHYVNLSGASRG